MQFARDAAAFILDLLIQPTRQVAAVGELGFGACRTTFILNVMLHRNHHSVERAAQRTGFAPRQRRQGNIKASLLQGVERMHHLVQRTCCTAHQPEHRSVHQQQNAQTGGGQQGNLVPRVEHRTRSVGAQHQAPIGKRNRLLHGRGGDEFRKPRWCLAPGLVGGLR